MPTVNSKTFIPAAGDESISDLLERAASIIEEQCEYLKSFCILDGDIWDTEFLEAKEEYDDHMALVASLRKKAQYLRE
jgi:hypothetical protein